MRVAYQTILIVKSQRSGKPNVQPQIDIGDLVYLYNDGNKSAARNRYIVTSVEDNWCNIRKLVGSQLRNASYRVKKSECYKVPYITVRA
jgi:hypothetical protein